MLQVRVVAETASGPVKEAVRRVAIRLVRTPAKVIVAEIAQEVAVPNAVPIVAAIVEEQRLSDERKRVELDGRGVRLRPFIPSDRSLTQFV